MFQGTWAWMATELSHIGPGKPVVHEAHHDLESFFYILLAICLLYDNPGHLKPTKVLVKCFDPFFAVTQPSMLKTITVQSNFGWTALMILYVSPHFRPLIPLLEKVWKELILPIKWHGDKVQVNGDFTHDDFIDSIVTTLSKLPDSCWLSRERINSSSTAAVPQGSSTSSCITPPHTTSTASPSCRIFRLSGDSLQWVPPIQIPGTSSASSLKHRFENELTSDSRLAKRCSPVSGAGDRSVSGSRSTDSEVSSTVVSWVNVDESNTVM